MDFAIQVARKSDFPRVITMEYSITTERAKVLHGLRSRFRCDIRQLIIGIRSFVAV